MQVQIWSKPAMERVSKNLKVLFVFGTRPEAIKMAPVIAELKSFPEKFSIKVCVTAQHRQMLDQVLALFDIIPDYDLDIMKPGQTLFDITCSVLQGTRSVFEKEKPDIVLVHGDTTTTIAASLSAFYCQIPVGHIEAGLRSFNKYAPFPEEMNRRVTGSLADVHFAPTATAQLNLLREGIREGSVHITGNTVVDALLSVANRMRSNDVLQSEMRKTFSFLDPQKRLILVTGHRRENFGTGFETMCEALARIAEERKDVELVFPVHLNPNVQEPVMRILGGNSHNNIHLIKPVDYLPFVYLMNRSYLIITDSGGVQEEAPSLGKPVLVMRETTERPEAVEAGTVKLVGTDMAKIVGETTCLLDSEAAYKAMSTAHNPYGDGKAAERIRTILEGLLTSFHPETVTV